MIGPHYRPQLTSILSITHRATGVLLSVVGAPLMLWWIAAVASGPQSYQSVAAFFDHWIGALLLAACLLSLNFHLFNGIRHLIWDSGRALDLRSAYTGGWLALIATAVFTAILLGILT
jgi:succinate dehydrogenase / fumarate reductase cytochrome b subunit